MSRTRTLLGAIFKNIFRKLIKFIEIPSKLNLQFNNITIKYQKQLLEDDKSARIRLQTHTHNKGEMHPFENTGSRSKH